jgi:hypothetical protein
MGARNRARTELSPAYVAWRANTTTLFLLFLHFLLLGQTYNFSILNLRGIQTEKTGLRLQI